MPTRLHALFWWLFSAQFVVFTILLTLGMRTIANDTVVVAYCAILNFAAVRRSGLGNGPPSSD
jgi:hypothetical protein